MGTSNAISVVHLLRLQEVPLGPRNAFIECVMATCDHPSDLFHHIAYPSLGRPGLRTDWPLPALPPEEAKRSPASSSLQGVEAGDIFRESLIVSGKSRPRNPWAAVGALGFQLSVLPDVSCRSAVSHGSAAQKTNANDVISASAGRSCQCHEASSAHAHVHLNQHQHSRPNSWDARSATTSGRHNERSRRGSSWRSGRRSSRWSA